MRLFVGLTAGLAGTLAMDAFSAAVNRGGSRLEAWGAAPGRDRLFRGVQPAQADGGATDDATIRAGTAAFRALTGGEPGCSARRWLGTLAHYGFGISAGIGYAFASAKLPALRAGFGTLYGLLVWAAADETLMPALGLSRPPTRLTPGLHAYAIGGHLAFGAGLEAAYRSLEG
jgi:hypothetical protein